MNADSRSCIIAPRSPVPLRQKALHPGRYYQQRKEDKEAQRQEEYEREQWALRWCVVMNLRDSGGDPFVEYAPSVEDIREFPAAAPTWRQVLFRFKPGQEFADVEGRHRRLASCLASDRVVIERFVYEYSDRPLRECAWAFSVSYEIASPDENHNSRLGNDPPHLYPLHLCYSEQTFAVRWAVGNAFTDVGLKSPLSLTVDLVSRKQTGVVRWDTTWRLPGTCSLSAIIPSLGGAKAIETMANLQEHLGCDSLMIEQLRHKEFRLVMENHSYTSDIAGEETEARQGSPVLADNCRP